jgi:hypothetical protein
MEGFVIQVWNGRRWAKVRGVEGGPYLTRDRAERIAASRERQPMRTSSTEGMPHRVKAAASNA